MEMCVLNVEVVIFGLKSFVTCESLTAIFPSCFSIFIFLLPAARVSISESQFSYNLTANYTYYNPNNVFVEQPQSFANSTPAAKAACGNNTACYVDYTVSSDLAMSTVAAQVQLTNETVAAGKVVTYGCQGLCYASLCYHVDDFVCLNIYDMQEISKSRSREPSG